MVNSDIPVIEGGKRILGQAALPNGPKPLISVFTVCRNAAQTIQAAIDSVKQQTYPNIEYVIIDGRSDDGTLDILRDNASEVDYFISQSDDGIYDAMNKAISLCRGEYIALLNADDRLYPEFLQNSYENLIDSDADISYCDYENEDGVVLCRDINHGIYFTQLAIKHNTFLTRKDAYKRVGMFDINYPVTADAKWNRTAFRQGLKFAYLQEPLVFYSSLGISAAHTPESKEAIILQSAALIQEFFPFLDERQSRQIYESNFNNQKAEAIIEIYDRYHADYPDFAKAIREFIRFNFDFRAAYHLSPNDWGGIRRSIALCQALDLPLTDIQITDDEHCIGDSIGSISRLANIVSQDNRTCVLHLAAKFSSPTEPFILELLNNLAEQQPDRLHIMLCDERLLEDIRLYDNVICIRYDALDDRVRREIYKLMCELLKPVLLVGHFALNGFKIFQRFPREYRDLPTINVCHGIDVFGIEPNTEYHSYITKYGAIAPRLCFTTVSGFLGDQLNKSGVAEERIFRLYNTISPNFRKNRKNSDYYDGTRPLNILSVGRLIGWKNHDGLLRALAEARPHIQGGFKLTIVYGNWGEKLDDLQKLAEDLEISSEVDFVPFIDFNEEQDYFRKFDLFIIPSSLSDDAVPRTETFGVSLLEAITSGLPVIASDAGGLPETIGTTNPQARIFPHQSTGALRDCIIGMVENKEDVFTDNRAYADERFEQFSKDVQYAQWMDAEKWVSRPMPKVYHVCSLASGGAAKATINGHIALCEAGYDSMFVTRHESYVSPFTPNVIKLKPNLSFDYQQSQIKNEIRPRHTVFSIDDINIDDATLIDLFEDADLVNFTWFAQFISSDNISALAKHGVPIAITVRDMNPITGGCHYFHGCQKWQESCDNCPQLLNNNDNIPHSVIRNKIENWPDEDITFVTLSDHVGEILKASPVAQNKNIRKISNYIDAGVYFTTSKEKARLSFGFTEDMFVIAYLPSFNSKVKGHDYIVPALKSLRALKPELKAVLAIAADDFPDEVSVPFPIVKIGHIHDQDRLRDYYNAADVVLVPSEEETFSNTAIEALACGAPVVGFQTGILPEVLNQGEGQFGAALPVGDFEGMAGAIARLADTSTDRASCSELATSTFSKERWLSAYESLIDASVAKRSDTRKKKTLNAEALIKRDLNVKRVKRKADGALQRLSNLANSVRRSRPRDKIDTRHFLSVTPSLPVELVGDLQCGPGTERDWMGRIHIANSQASTVVYGPYLKLRAGHYRIVYNLESSAGSAILLKTRRAKIIVECCLASDNVVNQKQVSSKAWSIGGIRDFIDFEVPSDLVKPDEKFEFRIYCSTPLKLTLCSAHLVRRDLK